jgi:hypothetical protein
MDRLSMMRVDGRACEWRKIDRSAGVYFELM